jgi:hypothetical protein
MSLKPNGPDSGIIAEVRSRHPATEGSPTTDQPPPTEIDYASVRAATEALTARGWRPSTLNEQMESWENLVGQVEVGYHLTIDDYTNDLSARRWLEEARPLLTELVRASLDSRLDPLDKRFRAATREARGMPGAGPEWWYRLPVRLVDELAEDVVRMGLADS